MPVNWKPLIVTDPEILRGKPRLVNAFSKKFDNLKAAVALYVAWYNLCRVHRTLRVTPAMEAGLTNRIWTVDELVSGGTLLDRDAA